jgi:regulator of nucleoside diphosphate kinase
MKAGIIDMTKQAIIMSAADYEELCCVVAAAGRLSKRALEEVAALERELTRAQIVAPADVPPDVITMNSRAELRDLESGELMEFTLVYPEESNIDEGKISVLAPLGAAMIGYRVGDEFTWLVPFGERRLRVTAVHFQPEAEFNRAAPCPSSATSLLNS